MIVLPHMGLVKWDSLSDYFSHTQLAANWEAVDNHDHSEGKGVKIPYGGLAEQSVGVENMRASAKEALVPANNSITTAKLAPSAVTAEKIAKESVSFEKMAPAWYLAGQIGSAGEILAGEGFTVTHPATGEYGITANVAFTRNAICVAMVHGAFNRIARGYGVSKTFWTVGTATSGEVLTNSQFAFIIMPNSN